MSIKVMTRVWDKAEQKGSELLLLLAMADVATEDGICWPGTSYLAKRIRMTERHVKRLIDNLILQGAISCIPGSGRNNFDHYVILVGLDEAGRAHVQSLLEKKVYGSSGANKKPYTKGDNLSPKLEKKGCQNVTDKKGDILERVTNCPEKGDICDQKRVTFSHEGKHPFTRNVMPQTLTPLGGDTNHDTMTHVVDVVVDEGRYAPTDSSTQKETENDLVSFLLNQTEPMSAATEFADIPFEIGKENFLIRRAMGQHIGTIVKAWRRKRPTVEDNHALLEESRKRATPASPGNSATGKSKRRAGPAAGNRRPPVGTGNSLPEFLKPGWEPDDNDEA